MEQETFREQIEPILPPQPGVYRFISADDSLLYVGKAKNLKSRVTSYFVKSNQHTGRIRLLVKQASNVLFTVVDSEHDALLLENNLIKEHQPKYNVMLKDDKSYPFIVIKNERFPRIFLTRNRTNDGSEYLGPFTSISRVRMVLDFVRQAYPLRTCALSLSETNIKAKKFKVCLEYHLGNCLGPCEGLQDERDYRANMDQIRQIVKGKTGVVLQALKAEMLAHAERYEYEQAEQLRKKIAHLEKYQVNSTVVSPQIDNVDVYGITMVEQRAFITWFRVVQGAIIHTHAMQLKAQMDESPADLLTYAILTMRDRMDSTAREALVPFLPEYSINDLELAVPQRGDKKKLLDLALRNALEYRNRILTRVDRHKMKGNSAMRVLSQLQLDFRMNNMPEHIECFDNSNTQGSFPVASCVVFRHGRPAKKDYRHYNIKTVEGPNDFASMEEVVYRRYKRMLEEETPLPQLVLIDGGKGQLSAAFSSLKRLGLQDKIQLVSIAKRLEEIYFPNDSVPLHINKRSESLRLLQKIRDEAHRFAITFHRLKRSKAGIRTGLSDVPGIGAKTADALLKHFRSIKKIREATSEELAGIVGKARAEKIRAFFETSQPPHQD